MRKVAGILIAIVLIFCGPAMAAWTIDVSQEAGAGGKNIIKVELTGDGTALSQDIWSVIAAATDFDSAGLLGKYTYRFKTDPDGTNAPGSTYALTITDSMGDTATLSARSTTATEYGKISQHTASGGYLSIYGYLLLTCEDIGSGNKTVLYLEVIE